MTATPAEGHTATVSARAVAKLLGAIALFLVCAHALVVLAIVNGHRRVFGLVPLFDLEIEQNIPSFYSGSLLMLAAVLTATIYCVERASRQGPHWAALAVGFTYIAYDELFKVHESWGPPIKRMLNQTDLGLFSFAWTIVGLMIVAFLAIAFLPFLVRLPAVSRHRFLGAGVVYLSGAILTEMVGGWWSSQQGSIVVYKTLVMFEEGLEMGGIIIFIWAAIRHLADRPGSVTLRFHDGCRLTGSHTVTDAAPPAS